MSLRALSYVFPLELDPSEKFVLVALADSANDVGSAWPSLVTITRKTGYSERTVRRALVNLVAAGALIQTEAGGGGELGGSGSGRTGRYQIVGIEGVPVPNVRGGRQGLSPDQRAEVVELFNGTCHWCKRQGTERLGPDQRLWHMDRIIPARDGGQYTMGNVVLACAECDAKDPVTVTPYLPAGQIPCQGDTLSAEQEGLTVTGLRPNDPVTVTPLSPNYPVTVTPDP